MSSPTKLNLQRSAGLSLASFRSTTLAPLMGLATFMALPMSTWAAGQDQSAGQGAVGDLTLPATTIDSHTDAPYITDKLSSSKSTEPLLDTPQSVTVVSSQLLKEQNAQSLKDALRNVPGITFNSGEGGGGVGDSLTIRGFNADGNIYRDGVRDPAKYSRNDFF